MRAGIFIIALFFTAAGFAHDGDFDESTDNTVDYTDYDYAQPKSISPDIRPDADEMTRAAIDAIFSRMKTLKLSGSAVIKEVDDLLGSDEFNNPISKSELTSFKKALQEDLTLNVNPPQETPKKEPRREVAVSSKEPGLPEQFKPLSTILSVDSNYKDASIETWKRAIERGPEK